MMKSIIASFIISISLFLPVHAQQAQKNGAEILKEIEKVGVLNRVLYIAAHPDDENTRLITYLSKGLNVNTAYFSLTRGDGGQNLIGDEKGPLLGMIRTQELLEARSLDGGTQYFSRAIDFGYSKSSEETFKHWDRDILLSDAVRVIRKFKPDMIITRFPPDSRAGHGQHTVSAIIATEAFEAAANPILFPETAKEFGPWETKKLYWNHSSWWNKDIEAHKDEYTTVNVGAYDPALGVSYSEIASHSRSQHQSQGFGMSIQRGNEVEYLELIEGDSTIADLLENKLRNWDSQKEGSSIQKKLDKILDNYKVNAPQESIAALTELYFAIENMPSNTYQEEKKILVKNIIADCGGLWMDFRTDNPLLVVDKDFISTAYVISQSNYPFVLKSIQMGDAKKLFDKKLDNTYLEWESNLSGIPEISNPYWISAPNDGNTFAVDNNALIGKPQNNPVTTATFIFETPQGNLEYQRPLTYKWTDRVRGELYRPVNVVEPLSASFTKKVALAIDNKIEVRVRANEPTENIKVQLTWGEGDIYTSDIMDIAALDQGQSLSVTFVLIDDLDKLNTIKIKVWQKGHKAFQNGLIEIAYPHIETQVVLPPSQLTLIKESIKVNRTKLGYINGSGDEIPAALNEMGVEVVFLDPSKMTMEDLKSVEGVIVGIRAYNKVKAMKSAAPLLNKYIYEGGFLLVQYNTNRGLITDQLGPYPFTLSRDRVTEEDATTIRYQRDNPLLKVPNVINDEDFDNWVQERGLYFANEWDKRYTAVLGWKDTGEDLKSGAILMTPYGEGHYIYTGISFFRQLPAGVLGAYKLFANLISYGAPDKETNQTKSRP